MIPMTRLVAVGLVATASASLAAEPAPVDIAIGPLNRAMTVAQVAAAVPGATVRNEAYVDAPAAFKLGGVPVDLSYFRRADGKTRVELAAQTPVANGECIAQLDAVLRQLEPQFGPFHPDDVSGYKIREAGARSTIGWFLSKDYGRGQDGLVQASAYVRGNGARYTVIALADEVRNLAVDADGRLECELSVYVDYVQQPSGG